MFPLIVLWLMGYVPSELPIDRVVLVGRLLVVDRRANVDDVARISKCLAGRGHSGVILASSLNYHQLVHS